MSINPDKVTIVSGEPRSGTSMMMQTLNILGLPVIGDEKPLATKIDKLATKEVELSEEEKERLEKRKNKAEKMNPLGFFEVPGIVMKGLHGDEVDEFYGKIVKIIGSAIPERMAPSGIITGTEKKIIDKIILCIRNPKHIALSQVDISSNIDVQIADIGESEDVVFTENRQIPTPLRYIRGMGVFIKWLDENPDMKDKILVVDYEDMHSNPSQQIDKICDFLGENPSDELKQKAIDNVKPSLKRSNDFSDWDEKFKDDGELVELMYNALKTLNTVSVTALIEERQQMDRLENASWLDEEFNLWIRVQPSLFRSLGKNNRNVRTELEKSSIARRQAGRTSDQCKYYDRNGEEYTIKRPEDIGDLTRKKVVCTRDKDEKTIEQCLTCWNSGWHRNNNHKEAERITQKGA